MEIGRLGNGITPGQKLLEVIFPGRQGRGGFGDIGATLEIGRELSRNLPEFMIQIIFLRDYDLLCRLRPDFDPSVPVNQIDNLPFINGESAEVLNQLPEAEISVTVHSMSSLKNPEDARAPLNFHIIEPDLDFSTLGGKSENYLLGQRERKIWVLASGYGVDGKGLGYYLNPAAREKAQNQRSLLFRLQRKNKRLELLQKCGVLNRIFSLADKNTYDPHLYPALISLNQTALYLEDEIESLKPMLDPASKDFRNFENFCIDFADLLEIEKQITQMKELSAQKIPDSSLLFSTARALSKSATLKKFTSSERYETGKDSLAQACRQEIESLGYFREWLEYFQHDHQLESALWGTAYYYMPWNLAGYLGGVRKAYAERIIHPHKKCIIFNFFGKYFSRIPGIFLDDWGSQANLIDLAAQRVYFPQKSDFSITLINLGFSPCLEDFSYLADLPLMVTGNLSLGFAQSTGQPFLYESWGHLWPLKERLIKLSRKFLSEKDARFLAEAIEIDTSGRYPRSPASSKAFSRRGKKVYQRLSRVCWEKYNLHANLAKRIRAEL